MIMNPRRRGLAGLLAAAAAALGLAGATPAPADAAPTLAVGHTATFAHLKVTVSKTERHDPNFFGAKIKVCVTSLPAGSSSMRLSWDPWTISGGIKAGDGIELGDDPWSGADAPTSGHFRVGHCLSGWLPFASPGRANITRVYYRNSLGNQATWKVINGASQQRPLGTTKTFSHFTVRVTDARSDGRGYRVYAKVCVRSLPAGSTGGRARISWDPWYVSGGTWFAAAPYAADAARSWANLFPRTGRYLVGQCAKGWIPFEGLDSGDVGVDQIAYANSLGDKGYWTAP